MPGARTSVTPTASVPVADTPDMATTPSRPMRELWATVAVLALGSAWYLAFITVGGGSEAIAYTFLPVGGAIAVVAVLRLCREAPLDRPALRFWRRLMGCFRPLCGRRLECRFGHDRWPP